MKSNSNSSAVRGLLAVALLSLAVVVQQAGAKKKFFERPGIMSANILKARGYLADDFNLITPDGYILRLVRGRNPLINKGQGGLPNRTPILFIHGILEAANLWVVNSFDVKPSDLSNLTMAGVPINVLNTRLGDHPSARSLPLLAMDLGHEIFILSRRGFPGSQARVGDSSRGSTDDGKNENIRGPVSAFWKALMNYGHLGQNIRFSMNRKFWNFSLDEQAKYDFPVAVKFVREQTKHDKIALVGHSIGGALALMAMSIYPELNNQLSAVICWSQAFSPGHNDLEVMGTLLTPLLKAYIGPAPPVYLVDQVQGLLNVMCSFRFVRSIFCNRLGEFFLGFSAGNAPMKPEFINSLLYSSSSHELAQTIQSAPLDGQMHEYSRLFHKAKPYNLSRITNTRISFYIAPTDALVSVRDNKATLDSLKVAVRKHILPGLFNHNSYFYDVNNSRAAIIPTLKEIHELTSGWEPPALVQPLQLQLGAKNKSPPPGPMLALNASAAAQ